MGDHLWLCLCLGTMPSQCHENLGDLSCYMRPWWRLGPDCVCGPCLGLCPTATMVWVDVHGSHDHQSPRVR